MKYKTYIVFDDEPMNSLPVTQKYKILDVVKKNGVEYECYNIVVGRGFTEYGFTKKDFIK